MSESTIFNKDISLKILEHIYSILDYKPTDLERQENLYNIKILLNQDIIIEKNINKNVNNINDNYNIGNYYILKEKDAEVINMTWSADFMEKYMYKNDIDIITYLRNQDLTLDMINKYFIIYTNIKLLQIQKNKEKDELDYVIN